MWLALKVSIQDNKRWRWGLSDSASEIKTAKYKTLCVILNWNKATYFRYKVAYRRSICRKSIRWRWDRPTCSHLCSETKPSCRGRSSVRSPCRVSVSEGGSCNGLERKTSFKNNYTKWNHVLNTTVRQYNLHKENSYRSLF